MKKPELLAPAGNFDCLKAAIEAGCDAVYLGGYTFGARNYAGNFSDEEIVEAINYSHLYGVKVYVTVNTIVYEEEVEMFLNYIDFLHKNNVDAVLIQDLGMLDLVRKTYPNLEVHASTQMHIHNLEGVKFAESMGIKRVVLARETNFELIKEIRNNTNLELEIFIHGALCISYSGQCLMSYMIGGRSGNRGTCAQACRMKYDLISDKKINTNKYLLSTKDLNTIEHIYKLIDLGVDSLKIEGRMKRPEYVYLITSLYRKAIDNYVDFNNKKINQNDILEMKKIFNRKFTKGFLFNEENDNFINSYRPNHIGIEIGKVISKGKRLKIKLLEDINQGDGIRLLESDNGGILNRIYKNNLLVNKAFKNDIIEIDMDGNINDTVVKTTDILQLNRIDDLIKLNNRKINIDMTIKLFKEKTAELIINDGKNEVKYCYGVVEQSIKNSMSDDEIKKQLKKLGNTIYKLNNLNIIKDDDIFIRISDLNELRRKTIELLNEKRLYKKPYIKDHYNIEVNEYEEPIGNSIVISDLEEYKLIKNDDFKTIYTDNIELINIDKRIIYKNSRVLEHVKKIDNCLNGEIGSLYLNKGYSDFSLNVVNSYTVALLHSMGVKRITLSYELTDFQIINLINNYKKRYNKKPNLELIILDRPEVMVMKYDLLGNYKIKKGYLLDEKNRKFKIDRKNNLTYIYNFEVIKRNKLEGINTYRINKTQV